VGRFCSVGVGHSGEGLLRSQPQPSRTEVWKPNRQVRVVQRGFTLRVQAPDAFRLRWSLDSWQTAADTPSSPTALGIEFVDIPIPVDQNKPVSFTFFWPGRGQWEGAITW
jgi:hypothetical protein